MSFQEFLVLVTFLGAISFLVKKFFFKKKKTTKACGQDDCGC
jgi:hypothetical protein